MQGYHITTDQHVGAIWKRNPRGSLPPRQSYPEQAPDTGLLQGTLNQVVRFGVEARDAARGGGDDDDGDGNGDNVGLLNQLHPTYYYSSTHHSLVYSEHVLTSHTVDMHG